MKYDTANIGIIYETCKRLHDYFMIELNYYVFMVILLYCHNPLAELSQCILDSSNGSIINVI